MDGDGDARRGPYNHALPAALPRGLVGARFVSRVTEENENASGVFLSLFIGQVNESGARESADLTCTAEPTSTIHCRDSSHPPGMCHFAARGPLRAPAVSRVCVLFRCEAERITFLPHQRRTLAQTQALAWMWRG